MKSIGARGVAGSLAVLAAMAGVGPARAQGAEEGIMLGTVTVEGEGIASDPTGPGDGYRATTSQSATKTGSPILETPQAVQVLTRGLMDDQGSRSMTDVLRNAAGVMPGGYYYGWDYFRIRGFDADASLFIDGLSNSYYVSTSLDPYLFDRIEVVRGPASTLYGAGSLGGMVNAVSKRPIMDDFADFEFIYGTEGDYIGRVDAGGVLTDDGTLLGRLLVSYGSDDTFIDEVDPSEHLAIAPSITWNPTTATSFTLLTQYATDDNEGAPTLPAYGTVLPNANGSIPLDTFLGEPDAPESVELETARIGYEFRHEFNDSIAIRQNARVTWHNEDWANIIYPSGFPLGDDRTLLRFYYSRESKALIGNIDTALEARFDVGGFEHFLAFGLDYGYFDEDATASNFTQFDTIDIFTLNYNGTVPAQPLVAPAKTTMRQFGVYLQDQIRYEDLTLTLGGRIDDASVEDLTQKSSDSKFSPKVGLTYEFLPGFAAYANYSQSFMPQPGYLTASGANADPETGENYEVGLKVESEDGTLSGTIDVFQLTRQNVVDDNPSGVLPSGSFFYGVTGEQRSRGLEADVRWSPIAGLDVTAAYTYTDAEVTDDANAAKIGQTVRNVPKHIFSAWAHYRLQEGPLAGFGFGAGVNHYTEQEGTLPNSFTLPAYTLVNAAVSYETGPFSVQLNVNNVLDEEYYVGSYSDFYVLPGAPTEAQLTVGYKF
ncbi:TonB-dependent siderophore receptor [Zavarzinia compransoris]|uniref:TonB-dependent siderophore receptor n=1 Tax=Zavarzinia marina TaxID=2911065 RepID=UPI001F404B03|nr:TonB-dependent siderophore receptor [Zavarzinia marina]MCF4167204.1 TonB-dependent siderophore receptor [Zavarzinia marina]